MGLGLSGLLDSKLRDEVATIGGKHGILRFLHGKQIEGVRVMPFELLNMQEKTTWRMRRRLAALCRQERGTGVIVRSSEKNDLDGLVDATPTKRATVGVVFTGSVNQVVREVQDGCTSDELVEFSKKEGGDYSPNRATVSVSPFIAHTKFAVVTEHPNMDDIVLVDIADWKHWHEQDGVNFPEYTTYNFENNSPTYASFHASTSRYDEHMPLAKRAKQVLSYLRSTGYFATDVALQLEVGFPDDGSAPILFQVRQFAEFQKGDFELRRSDNAVSKHRMCRTFGVTPEEGLTLRVVRGQNRREMLDFEEAFPDEPYVLATSFIGNALKLDECPRNMQGYVVTRYGKPALPHQNTRFVQMVLKRGGIAILDDPIVKIGSHKSLTRFVANGRVMNLHRDAA